MIWKSSYEDVEVGGATLHGMILEAAGRFHERPALIDGTDGVVMTYDLLASHVSALAAGLTARGLRTGDVVAVWAPNLPEWAGVALGTMAAGGTVTGVTPLATGQELARQLEDAGASFLVTTPSLVGTAHAAATAAVREIITIGDAPEGATPLSALLDPSPPALNVVIDPASTVALLPYSSGTTGLPKGVMLTHANLVTVVRQLQRAFRLRPADTTVAVAPFAHVMGFVIHLCLSLAHGATVVTMQRFDMARYLALAAEHSATVLVGPPPLMTALARHPLVAEHDLGAVELIVSGGAPLGANLQRAVAERFPRAAVGQGWGLTETAVAIALPDRTHATVPGSVGRVMANAELRVVKPETGLDLGPDQVGELWARGPMVMAGYLGRPDATADLIDRDGWLRTGDLGRVDSEGNVTVIDRLKELIKVSGHQVAPAELEALLLAHPGVADAAVVGRWDQRHGEVPVALVVAAGELDGDALLAWVAARIAPHKRLRAVRLVESLPRTASGKLLRKELAKERDWAKV